MPSEYMGMCYNPHNSKSKLKASLGYKTSHCLKTTEKDF